MKVKLEDIIEAMEFAGMETEYYYATKLFTAEVTFVAAVVFP